MTMREFADHILARAQETKHPVTNLSLQKIMYFVLRNSSQILTRDEQEEIYSEPFLVWRYGPVVESEYNRFNIFGSSEIVGEYQANQRYEKLNPLIDKFLDVAPFRMVSASHTHHFWKNNQEAIVYGRSDISYPLDDVLRDGTTN